MLFATKLTNVAPNFKIEIMAYLGRNEVLVYILREKEREKEREREKRDGVAH